MKDIFNREELLEKFFNETEIVKDVIVVFMKKLESQIDVIDDSIDMHDFEKIRFEAHSIKGGAYNITAKRLGDASLNLESAAKKSEMVSIKKYFEDVKNERSELFSYLKDINF